jgi:DmsE family decaheme c-type cytochrome
MAAIARGQPPANSCATCHADLVKGFADTPHGTAAAAHAGSGITCANCHGDGKAHAESNGDITQIKNPARFTAQQADALCQTCHAAQHPDFARSAHARANIGCVSCHSVHAGKAGKLLKASQPALCYQCHAGVKSQFSEPVHHNVGEGAMSCTSCHDPHVVSEPQLEAFIARQNSTCFKCHTKRAGPFKYQHGAIRQVGCTACHAPHGSVNPKLLNQAEVNTICLECHLPAATVSDARVNAAHTPSSTTACTECHSSIHGSNHDQYFGAP